jgi:electron transfer flavoprotein alpha subunit
MSVLIYVDHIDGHIRKASFEALSYGAKLADQTGDQAEAIILGSVNEDLSSLGQYGIKKVYQVQNEGLNQFD